MNIALNSIRSAFFHRTVDIFTQILLLPYKNFQRGVEAINETRRNAEFLSVKSFTTGGKLNEKFGGSGGTVLNIHFSR